MILLIASGEICHQVVELEATDKVYQAASA
jgi:hypothetical protein